MEHQMPSLPHKRIFLGKCEREALIEGKGVHWQNQPTTRDKFVASLLVCRSLLLTEDWFSYHRAQLIWKEHTCFWSKLLVYETPVFAL